MPFDAIRHFHKKYGFQQQLVREIVIGEKYAAVILQDGRIGVCATLGQPMERILPNFSPDLKNTTHRIILNAFFNALLNDDPEFDGFDDIASVIDFRKFEHVVMVGYFRSLHWKLKESDVTLRVFDLNDDHPPIEPIQEMNHAIGEADALIVSSTTIFNGTLKEITDKATPGCEVFLLGPSTILHPDLFRHTPVTAMFGSLFNPHDKAVLKIIRSGGGTPDFAAHMKKVFLRCPAG